MSKHLSHGSWGVEVYNEITGMTYLEDTKPLLDFIIDFAHGRPNATQRAAEDLLVGLGYEGLTTHVTKELEDGQT